MLCVQEAGLLKYLDGSFPPLYATGDVHLWKGLGCHVSFLSVNLV